MGQYPTTPPASLKRPGYGPSPLRKIVTVSQGKESKPVPLPHGFGGNGPLNPVPTTTTEPGYSGSI